jgi:hypothetical protein
METEDAIDQLIPLATQGLFVIMVGSTAVKLKHATDLDILLANESDCQT